jgi:hypothetical protein
VKEIERLRATMRPSTIAGGTAQLVVLMIAAMASGIAICWVGIQLLVPPRRHASVAPLQPSASLPTFADVQASIKAGQPPPTYRPDPAIQSAPRVIPDYRGKTAAEIGKTADAVCFQRAHARYPHWSKTPRLTTKELSDFSGDDMNHFNELLRCLLTEGERRYCSRGERQMITGEIAMYFRGIEYSNRMLDRYYKIVETSPRLVPRFETQNPRAAYVTPDMSVEAAIERRLLDGLLTAADRDRFLAVAPQNLRERFSRIQPPRSTCPQEPWWAFWR